MTTTYITIESFIEAVIAELREKMDDCDIAENTVVKANDTTLHGITARELGSDIAPTVYADGYHEEHMNGRTLESIVNEMIFIFRNSSAEGIKEATKMPMDFESIRDKLTLRLLDMEKNREFLKTHPFREIGGGLVITADISFGNDYFAAVTDDMATSFGDNDIFETAIGNMERLYPARLTSIESALFGNGSANALTDGTERIEGMNTLMNDRTFGASAIAYPNITEKIRALYGTDFFLLPSSKHELILVPDDGNFTVEHLVGIVGEANRTVVSGEDMLSDGVFHCNGSTISRVA